MKVSQLTTTLQQPMSTRDQAPGPTIQRVMHTTPPELPSRHYQFVLLRHKLVDLQKPLSKSLPVLSCTTSIDLVELPSSASMTESRSVLLYPV